jgi:hypothetical protein
MWCYVEIVRTDFAKEHVAFHLQGGRNRPDRKVSSNEQTGNDPIWRVLSTLKMAATCSRATGTISHKVAFLIVTALKISDRTTPSNLLFIFYIVRALP